MSSTRRPGERLLLYATRPCITCGHPFVTNRLPTADLRRFGWLPHQAGVLSPPCGHPQPVVPVPAPGVPGWWTFIPLLGRGIAPAPPRPRPPGFDFLVARDPGEEHGYLETDPELRAIMTRLLEERAAIQSLADEAACRLCGQTEALTEEHAPSQAAGNEGLILGMRVDDVATAASGALVWTADTPARDGATVRSLCAPCNNNTGRRYNKAYVGLVEAAEPIAVPQRAGQWCELTVANRPLIAKQALTWLVATSQPGFTARHPHVRTLVAKTSARARLTPLRLWCHLMANRVGTFTGLAALLNRRRREGQLVASFAWWPLAWLLTTGDVPIEGAVDVSDWLQLKKHTNKVTIRLPVHWRFTTYPTDFRTPDRVLREGQGEHRGRIHLR